MLRYSQKFLLCCQFIFPDCGVFFLSYNSLVCQNLHLMDECYMTFCAEIFFFSVDTGIGYRVVYLSS